MKIMKKSYLILTAIASVALAGCTNDDLTQGNLENPTRPVEINFGSQFAAITRADFEGEAAATKLGNKFVVTGYKGAQSAYSATSSITVFDNYLVEWTENTANITESNSTNWEYVGKGPYVASNANTQAVKYWDYSQAQYDFIAYSLGGKTAITSAYDATNDAGKIQVTAIDPANMKTAAYTLTGSANDLASCYIADIVTVGKNDYGNNPVTIRFRNLTTKVRIGLYENIPGYKVKGVEFYAQDGTKGTDAVLYASGATTVLCSAGDVGTYTVSYPNVDAATPDHTAHVSYSGGGDANASFGAFPQDAEISTSAAYPTYAGGGYALVLPNETGDKLVLRVDYTLISEDGSDEPIKVSGATAEVPAIYSSWMSGYAYTYIFKINPNTNGTTGTPGTTDPTGLYPITFDAAVIQDVEGNQETITTVSEPSITTYQAGHEVIDEFIHGSEITAMVMDNDVLATLTDKVFLYTIPAGLTEADVFAALEYQEDVLPDGAAAGTILGRNGKQLTPATGLTVSGTSATFTPAAGGTYAFIYKITEGAQTALYEKQSFTPGASVKGYFWDYTYEDQTGKDANVYATYYQQTVATPETYAQPATAPTFFYGQTLSGSGLYVKDESTVKPTYGTAHTGTTYYLEPVVLTAAELDALTTVDGLYTQSGSKYYPASGNKTDGVTYYKAPVEVQPLAYADIAAQITAHNLFTDAGTTEVTAVPTNATVGTIYYLKSGTVYNRVVLLPEHADGYYILSHSSKQACPDGETAIDGGTYYDRYWFYNGANYAVKVIKVE